MNNGSLKNAGDRGVALRARKLVVALTIGSLSMAIGCAGVKAVRTTTIDQPEVIPRVLSQRQQPVAESAIPPGVSPQTAYPQGESFNQANSQPHEIRHQPGEHQPYGNAPDSVSREEVTIPGQVPYPPTNQGAPQVAAPQIVLASYQAQQTTQPAQQSGQIQSLQTTGRPVSQGAESSSRPPANLGIPRQMLGNQTFEQSVETTVSMSPQPSQASRQVLPVQPNSISQQFPASVNAQMGDVVNVQGARFRSPPKTATELMLEFKADNDRLRHEIALGKQARANLKDQLDLQQKLNQQTELKLSKSRDQAGRLREIVAKLQVQVEHLVVEKDEIKQQSEAALRNIETNLDAVLMNSISRSRQKPVSLN